MDTENRKNDHLKLTPSSQQTVLTDTRFNYEPMFFSAQNSAVNFLGHNFSFPLWISSMTGGNTKGKIINKNLARAVNEFKLGMGLGSIRSYIEDDSKFDDFNLRPIIGDRPLFANLGIAQIEQYLSTNSRKFINKIKLLECNGLIVHINPLQEAAQREGDKLNNTPFATIEKLIKVYDGKLIIKEVGQGFGPRSLTALMDLDIAGIELAAHGGTNFTKLEILRASENECLSPLISVGHDNKSMIKKLNALNEFKKSDKEIIISGGLKNSLDGYYFNQQCDLNSIFAFAGSILSHSSNYEDLSVFITGQKKLYDTALSCLDINKSEW